MKIPTTAFEALLQLLLAHQRSRKQADALTMIAALRAKVALAQGVTPIERRETLRRMADRATALHLAKVVNASPNRLNSA